MGKPLNLGRKLCVVAEPKEKYAGVSIAPSKDQLAKVTVVGDEDAALLLRDRKHLFIRYTRWVIAADSSCIVAKIAKIGKKVGKKASIGALVKKKLHRLPGGVPEASCPTRWRFPSIAAWANY
jgi:hypothetical protein